MARKVTQNKTRNAVQEEMADRPAGAADPYAPLYLENQLCFPLYAGAKEIVHRYKPWLDRLDLTYTQYITMMVLWEKKRMNVKTLGEHLYLDSGTLTPVLKKLESKGYISRGRSEEDERNLIVALTEAGEALKREAVRIPAEMGACINLTPKEAAELYRLLYKLLGKSESAEEAESTEQTGQIG